jgi:hypothetical protein
MFHHDLTGWRMMDSIFSSYRHKLWVSPAGTLFAIGSGVHKRAAGVWQSLQRNDLISLGIAGTSDHDFFIVGMTGVGGTFGEVYHFNGTDWYQFKDLELRDVQYMGVWTNGEEAFVVGWSLGPVQTTVILHGK